MRLLRGVLGATGVVLVLVGLRHLLDGSLADLLDLSVWLAGGVLLHDAVLAPLVVLVGALVLPRLPVWCQAPVVVGLVVLLTVTLMALPAIGRFGARPDVPSLLNRAYGVEWLLLALLVLVVVAVASLLRRRSSSAVR